MCDCPCKTTVNPAFPTNQGNMMCNSKQCSNQLVSDTIQPSKYRTCQPIVPLNSMGIRLDGSYNKVATPFGGLCKTGFVTFDNPKSYDPIRAIHTVFDRPHYTGQVNVGNVCHDEIYDKQFREYGKGYRNYMDINAGQIQYYIDDSIKDPYFQPNFTTPSVVRQRLFVDPNNIVKPQYDRIPMTKYSWNKPYDACDSYTHDSLEFRQDIMALQQRKNNQERWSNRWSDTVLTGMSD